MTDRTGDATELQVIVNSGNLDLSDAVEHEAHVQVKHALRHVAHMLTRVEVNFHDVNGPKQGVDKRILLEARIRGQDPQVTEHQAAEWHDAIKGASDKLERALRKHFEKLEDKRR